MGRDQKLLAIDHAEPLGRAGGSDDGFSHGHGFEHFVLDAAGDLEGDDGEGGGGEVGADVGDGADDFHAGDGRKAADGGVGVAADDGESGLGTGGEDLWPDFLAKPADSFDVGGVVERAYKDAAIGTHFRFGGAKILQVHAVGNGMGAVIRAEAAIDFRLRLADECDGLHAAGERAFELTQPPGFQLVEPFLGSVMGCRVVQELLTIHIDQVDDGGDALQARQVQVLHHARAKNHYGIELDLLRPLFQCLAELGGAKEPFCGGLSGSQAGRCPQPARTPELLDGHLLAARMESLVRTWFQGLVRQRRQINIGPPREEIEQVERPDAVASVRRVGNPVNQVQDVGLCTNDKSDALA